LVRIKTWRKKIDMKDNCYKKLLILRNIIFLAIIVFCILIGCQSNAFAGQQRGFEVPEVAVISFIDALRKDDRKELRLILGRGYKSVISTGDKKEDKQAISKFLQSYDKKHKLEEKGQNMMVLTTGEDDFRFPIPLVKRGDKWYFDTMAGKEEILRRKIGRNELKVIEVLHAYVLAQREYASKDRDGDGIKEFAQKLLSSKGKKDGLYWDSKEREDESPLGPFIAKAGYSIEKKYKRSPKPYFGYYYRILKAQGSNAPGGAYDYMVNGNMMLGFAFVAWPARYGSSGIMTFQVNQSDIVYEKDLGKDTAKIVKSMTTYNPDETWKRVD